MTISNIRKTFTTLALSSLCAAPVLAQDMQSGEPTEQTEAPVEHAEDSPVKFRNDPGQQERPMRDNRARSSERETRGEAQAVRRDDTQRGKAATAGDRGQTAGDRGQGAQQRAMENLHTDSVSLSNLDGAQVESLQRALQQNEFYSGPIDGLPGPQTRRALRRFYRAQADLASSGRLFSGGAAALGLEASEIELVKGKGEPERKTAAGREPSSAETSRDGQRQGRGAQATPRSDTASGTMDDSGERKMKDGERKMKDGERKMKDGERKMKDGERKLQNNERKLQNKKPSDQSPHDATRMH